MKRFFQSHIVTVGLAIFSMLFGAGNLVYPLLVGINTTSKVGTGIAAFSITAVLLPFIGLLAMILFDGNYEAFFNRLGSKAGKLMIFLCMLILGPVLVIPRIVTLSHSMMTPFIGWPFLAQINYASSFVFTLIFLGITFLCTYKESKIINLLGNVISPVLLLSLGAIIVKGIVMAPTMAQSAAPTMKVITDNLILGYGTLDLLGTIFFCAIVLTMLRKSFPDQSTASQKARLKLGLQSGLLGVCLLAIIYCGMALLGAYYAPFLAGSQNGAIFREISLHILGARAAIIIALAVLMACLSTAIALAAVCAEYMQKKLFRSNISYVTALLIVLASCIPLCIFGLTTVLNLTAGPITYIGYPVLITLTFANIAYKLFGFTPVKIPVAIVFAITILSYFI